MLAPMRRDVNDMSRKELIAERRGIPAGLPRPLDCRDLPPPLWRAARRQFGSMVEARAAARLPHPPRNHHWTGRRARRRTGMRFSPMTSISGTQRCSSASGSARSKALTWRATRPPRAGLASPSFRNFALAKSLACHFKPWRPPGCAPLPFGQEFCAGGVWTALCAKDEDCAKGMRCDWRLGEGSTPDSTTYGICAKTCRASGDACVRCDMECDSEAGVCRKRTEDREDDVDRISCTADCECPSSATCGSEGHCQISGRPRRGICGATGDCACNSPGVCREDLCRMLRTGTLQRPIAASAKSRIAK